MILEPNAPKYARNWALCQLKIRAAEYAVHRLAAGHPLDCTQFGKLKALGRERFATEVAEPMQRRLKRACRRYRALAAAIESRGDVRRHLFGKREMLELIGGTLHYAGDGGEVYETLQYCSADGEKLFGARHGERMDASDPRRGIDALGLLGLGFGRD